MARDHSSDIHLKRRGGMPLAIAIVIAILGILGMLIVDHGPWNKPKMHTGCDGQLHAPPVKPPEQPARW